MLKSWSKHAMYHIANLVKYPTLLNLKPERQKQQYSKRSEFFSRSVLAVQLRGQQPSTAVESKAPKQISLCISTLLIYCQEGWKQFQNFQILFRTVSVWPFFWNNCFFIYVLKMNSESSNISEEKVCISSQILGSFSMSLTNLSMAVLTSHLGVYSLHPYVIFLNQSHYLYLSSLNQHKM